MKSDDLFEIIGDISDRHIDGAKKTKNTGVWKKWTAMAACLCIVVAAAFMITLRVPDDTDKAYEGYVDSAGDEPDCTHDGFCDCNGGGVVTLTTSETYGTLEELLLALRGNDNHGRTLDSNGGGGNVSAEGDGVVYGAGAVAYDGYVYFIGDGTVRILKIDGGAENKGKSIEYAASELFVYEDTLILKGERTEGDELDYESYSVVRIYDLSDPTSPVFVNEYEQKGELVSCYMAGEKVYLLTTDGVCACGYSRYDDISEYKPSLTFNGEAIAWENGDIDILGEPTSVNYVAISVFNIEKGEITEHQAFYGDIEDVFYGSVYDDCWLVLETQSRTEETYTQPELYRFGYLNDDMICYSGKADLWEIAGIENSVKLKDGMLPDGVYLDVVSVTSVSGNFGIVGEYTKLSGDDVNRQVFAAAGNIDYPKSDIVFEVTELDGGNCSIDDILWDADDNVFICVSSVKETANDVVIENRFVTVNFYDLNDSEYAEIMSISVSDFTTDRVSGVENYYSYGSPYGNIKSIIHWGSGEYTRFNGVPNGFDIIGTDNQTFRILYKSESMLAEDERFDFIWHKLDNDKYGNAFGVMTMKMGAGENIRETEFSYRIYRVDPYQDEVFLLLNEYTFGKGGSFSSSSLGFEVFEYEGEYYFITQDTDTVTKIEF